MAHILIVEDNEANMRLARLLLVNAGHTVVWGRRRRKRPDPGP
jgi:two-component system cell cycle response regulator DivK